MSLSILETTLSKAIVNPFRLMNFLGSSFCTDRYRIPYTTGTHANLAVKTPLFETSVTDKEPDKIEFTLNPNIKDESIELMSLISGINFSNDRPCSNNKPCLNKVVIGEKIYYVPNELLPLRYAMMFRDAYYHKSKKEFKVSKGEKINSQWMLKHKDNYEKYIGRNKILSEYFKVPFFENFITNEQLFELLKNVNNTDIEFSVNDEKWSSHNSFLMVKNKPKILEKFIDVYKTSHTTFMQYPNETFFAEGGFSFNHIHRLDPSNYIFPYLHHDECLSTGVTSYFKSKYPGPYKHTSVNSIFASFYMVFVNAGIDVSELKISQ